MYLRSMLPAVLVLLAALWPLSARTAEPRQTLRHRLAAQVASLQPLERLPATNELHAAICLPLRNQPALTNLLRELYNPGSPNYRRYLTSEQFAAQFGPTPEDYEAVVTYAAAQGLTVTTRHPNRTLVDVHGTAAAFEHAFQVRLQRYRHPHENRTFYAPDRLPSVALALPVLSVCGLDNYAVPKPAGMRPVPAGTPRPQSGSGPSGNLMGYDFRRAYAPSVALTGAGQRVGLLQFDGYYAADIAAYISQAGLPAVPVQKVLIDGFSGAPGTNNSEVAMDIEMAISMAPGLDRVVVYAGDIHASPIHILNRMATDNTCKQLSASWTWGTLESGTEQVFLQFAAQGQSYFNASGDGDAYTGAIDAPADDPYVTVVGGTTLTTGSGASWSSETVWNWGGSGSGGGISTTYAIPSWQQGISMTANKGSPTKRNIPDVAMAADNIWVIYNNGTSGAFGGTSAAAPLWAAFTALVNQQAVARGLPTMGFLNPALYAIGTGNGYTAAFHDITSGNNTWSSSPSKFYAVAGYDLCTGWGTPNGQSLIDALAGEPLTVSPTNDVTAVGASGGPFNTDRQTYALTNTAGTSITWTCSSSAPWLAVSATNGLLPPYGFTVVTAQLTDTANTLTAGVYLAEIRFTDPLTSVILTRLFRLKIGQPLVENGGFEMGGFTGWTQSGNTNSTFVSAAPSYVHSGSYGACVGPAVTLGYLRQSIPTFPGTCLLSFWLNHPADNQPNEFQVAWNGQVLFDRTNLSATVGGWTCLKFLVVATGTVSSLQFGFRNDPGYFGLDDISVISPATNSPDVASLTVFPGYGVAAPAGTTNVLSGTTLAASIVNSPVVNGTTQYVCTGATVTGNAFTQNSPTNLSLTLTNHATVTWNWQQQFRLSTSTNGAGSVTAGGWFDAGASTTLTATAAPNAHFANWSGDTNGCALGGNTIVVPMTQARAIAANFEPTLFALTVLPGYGVAAPTGATNVLSGTTLAASIVNSPVVNGTTQFVCTGASVTGNAFTQNSPTNLSLTLTNHTTLTWNWQQQFRLSTSTNGAGTVTAGGWFDAGASTTLTATAAPNAHFANWSGDTNGCAVGGNTIIVPMTQARAIAAIFDPTIFALTVFPGYGVAAPAGTTNVLSGTTLAASIVNSPVVNGTTQYVCTGATVTGNAFTQNSPTNLSLTLTNNATLTWNWQQQFRLTTSTNGAGTVTAGGWFDTGASTTLTATAAPNAHFAGWSGDTNGCTVGGNTIVVPMTQARAIAALFSAGAQPVLSGRVVRNRTSLGMTNILLTFSNGGGTTTTDTNGVYAITLPYNWTGNVTLSPAADGAFSPAVKSYSRLTRSKANQNFKWLPPPVITGKVTPRGSSAGVGGIRVTFSGVGTTTTDSNGVYAMAVPYQWTGTLTPSNVVGGVFAPLARSYRKLTSNKSSQNFTWTPPIPAVVSAAAARTLRFERQSGAAPAVLLRTAGLARWSAGAAGEVRQALELLTVNVVDGKPVVALPAAVPAPAGLAVQLTAAPGLSAWAHPPSPPLTIRNQNSAVSAATGIPDATVIGSVSLLPFGEALFLTWDLTLLGP